MCVTSTSAGRLFGVNRKAVVVGGDLDLAGRQVLDRLVAAAMAEFQFVGFAAERLADQSGGPRQMPNIGIWVSVSFLISSTTFVIEAGSPGPFERKMPSGLRARTSSAECRPERP